MIQKTTQKTWKDESGQEIPITRITALERKKERYAERLLSKATKTSQLLSELKKELQELSFEIYQGAMDDLKVTKKSAKGNHTWYNFDRSIKIEVEINDRIEFDEMLIAACQAKLNEFLDDNLSQKEDYFRALISDAFASSKGQLDTRKVLSLLKHRSKIKAAKFQEAMKLLEESIRHPSSKTYHRVWLRNDEGKYENINLNLSSIQ